MIFRVVATIILLCSTAAAQTNPIAFVTQVPIPTDFATVNSTFANHLPDIKSRASGGDLWIRYPDGSLKNITRSAGFGNAGLQGASSIAVRDPAVHWSGSKILFSMIVGAPARQFDNNSTFRWQLFEVTRLGKDETPLITKVARQPSEYNNVMATYGTDDKILFISDRPRNGERHLHPQLDEYESTPTNTGIWRLDPVNGALTILDHAPSGDFHPAVDSFGRVVFSRWDHLQSDQQAGNNPDGSDRGFGAFNYRDEGTSGGRTASHEESFPELQDPASQQAKNPLVERHLMNLFLPWTIHEDGTNAETLNHIGRHELSGYISRTFNNDPNIVDYGGQYFRFNKNSITNFFQIKEDPSRPGTYYGVDAPEFGTHSAGQIISVNGAPSVPADKMTINYVTHRATASVTDTPDSNHSGLYRDPLPLRSGELLAVHTTSTQADQNIGVGGQPRSRYEFRIKRMVRGGDGHLRADAPLTSGIPASVNYWNPDFLLRFDNINMWELQPVEVVARPRPRGAEVTLEAPELSILSQAGVSAAALRDYLLKNDLALIVSRDVTTRDSSDLQQPFNLRIAGTSTQTLSAPGKVYDVSHLQIFQGDLVRGYGGIAQPRAGRRVLAKPMHDATNPVAVRGDNGMVKLGPDGSMAALVPARRALTWQLTAPSGEPVVRERVWMTFAAGEIRVCASCHGINSTSQVGRSAPVTPPQALRQLVEGLNLRASPQQPTPVPPTATPVRTTRPGQTPIPPRSTPTTIPPTVGVVPKIATYALTRRGAGALRGGSSFELIARGSGVTPLSLHLSIDGRACRTPIRVFRLKSDGTRRIRQQLPQVARIKQLRFSLASEGGELAVLTLPLQSVRRVEPSAGSLCRIFTKTEKRSRVQQRRG